MTGVLSGGIRCVLGTEKLKIIVVKFIGFK